MKIKLATPINGCIFQRVRLSSSTWIGFPRISNMVDGRVGEFSLYGSLVPSSITGIVLEEDSIDRGYYYACLDSFIQNLSLAEQTERIGCARICVSAGMMIGSVSMEELLTHPALIVRQKALTVLN